MREWSAVLDAMKTLQDLTEICETAPIFTLNESWSSVRELKRDGLHPPHRWPLLTVLNPSHYGEREKKHIRTVSYHLRSLSLMGDSSLLSHISYTNCDTVLLPYLIELLPSIPLQEKWWFNAVIHIANLIRQGNNAPIDYFVPWRALLAILEESDGAEKYEEVIMCITLITSIDIERRGDIGEEEVLRGMLEQMKL